MIDYYCSRCGEKAATDTRGGSLEAYLTCDCRKRGVWINDGRGGYWSNSAKPVTAEEYERLHHA